MREYEGVCVQVKDTGKGVNKEEANSIFEKYHRGTQAATHATGLGLGLYVAKIVIEQHHGKLWVESQGEGKGSTFVFTIPTHYTGEQITTLDLKKK